jgi:hypothetical protein
MNSLLGTAGFPPVEFPEAPKSASAAATAHAKLAPSSTWRQNGATRQVAEALGERELTQSDAPLPHS